MEQNKINYQAPEVCAFSLIPRRRILSVSDPNDTTTDNGEMQNGGFLDE